MSSGNDIINVLYHELFSIKFLHDGYGIPMSNTIANDIKLYPDADTEKLLAGHDIRYRVLNETLVCFMRCKLFAAPAKEPTVPYIPFSRNVRIRFLMYTTSAFMQKTFIVATGVKRIYQFSNLINNANPDGKFIGRSIESYAASGDYDAGTIVDQGGHLFASIKPMLGIQNIAINDTDYWKEITTAVTPLVNNADLVDPLTADVNEPCFAVLDIHNNGTTNLSYDLFSAGPDRTLKSPVYTIRFKNKT